MQLDLRHQQTVRRILAQLLPPEVGVLAFGSRVHGRNLKTFSDLDLCLKGREALPPAVLGALRSAFEESNLPIKIDLVDWHQLSPAFRQAIKPDLQPFELGKQ